jgi:hypothetical protein
MTLGLVLLGNPLFGPDLGISSYVVMLVGIGLLIVAIFLGGAGLGKGPLAQRLPLVSILNAASGVLLLAWALISSRSTGSRAFLILVAATLVALAGYQRMALSRPETSNRRRPSTQAERQAALRGEKPRVD